MLFIHIHVFSILAHCYFSLALGISLTPILSSDQMKCTTIQGVQPVTPTARTYTSTSSTTPSTEGRRYLSPDIGLQDAKHIHDIYKGSPGVDQTRAVASSDSDGLHEAEDQLARPRSNSNIVQRYDLAMEKEDEGLARIKKEKEELVQDAKDELREVQEQQEACLVKAKKALEEMHKEKEECLKAAKEDLQQIQMDGNVCLQRTKETIAGEKEFLCEQQCKIEELDKERAQNLKQVRGEWEEKLLALQESFREAKEAKEHELQTVADELEKELYTKQSEEIERVKTKAICEFEEKKVELIREVNEDIAQKMDSLKQELKENSERALVTHKDVLTVLNQEEKISKDGYDVQAGSNSNHINKEARSLGGAYLGKEGQEAMVLQVESNLRQELEAYKVEIGRQLQEQKTALVQAHEDMQVGIH